MAAAAFRSRAVKDEIKHLSIVMGFSRNVGASHLVLFFGGDNGNQDERSARSSRRAIAYMGKFE